MKIVRKLRKTVLLLIVAVAFLMLPASRTEAAVNYIAQAKKNVVTAGKLVSNNKGIRYCYKKQSFARNQWLSVNGKVYYFGPDTYAATGWFEYENNNYYANDNGVVYASKWLTLNEKKYWLKKNGIRAEKTWIKRNGNYYYFKNNGVMLSNTQIQYDGKYYYVGADGARKKSCWVNAGDKKYYFGKDGVRYQNKWLKYKGKYYHFASNGVMCTNKWVGNYYVGSDGARKTDCYVDGHYLDSTGKKEESTQKSDKFLFVGDSRTVGMDMFVSASKTKFIGKVSMGYSWLVSTAGPQVKQYLAANPRANVVFGFGINDLGNVSSYISYYKTLVKQYPKANFIFMSVNPVNEAIASRAGYRIKNADIKSFNKKLKNAFGEQYLNTFTWLKKNGFSTEDGLHYTGDTYKKLYNYIIKTTK